MPDMVSTWLDVDGLNGKPVFHQYSRTIYWAVITLVQLALAPGGRL